MKKIALTLSFLFVTLVAAQEPEVIIDDFNADGIQDRLECIREWRSNFGGVTCKVIDGQTKKVFELSYFGCYCEIKNMILVEPELREPQNAPFLSALSKEMLPPTNPRPDASLEWIIASTYSTTKPLDNSHFELIFNPKIKWKKGEVEFPSTYSIEMSVDSLLHLIPVENDTVIEHKTGFGYLIYHGKTHLTHNRILAEATEFINATEDDTYQILKTMHGVVAKKGDSFKWLFVTDMHSNSSPQKLRWESIEKVILIDEYLVIKQSLAPDPEYALYLVNIETGIGGRLKIDFDMLLAHDIEFLDLSPTEQFSIKDNTILIGNKVKTLRFPIEELKKDLDSFYKHE